MTANIIKMSDIRWSSSLSGRRRNWRTSIRARVMMITRIGSSSGSSSNISTIHLSHNLHLNHKTRPTITRRHTGIRHFLINKPRGSNILRSIHSIPSTFNIRPLISTSKPTQSRHLSRLPMPLDRDQRSTHDILNLPRSLRHPMRSCQNHSAPLIGRNLRKDNSQISPSICRIRLGASQYTP